MRVGNIVSLIGNTFNSNRNKDLVSFGVQERQNNNQNKMISKSAADALKSKYGANVSFDGHHKTVNITEEGHDEVTSRKYLYGSNGSVWHSLDTYQGYSYQGAGFMREEVQKKWVTDQYSAKMDGSRKIGTHKTSQETALTNLITGSQYFKKGSTIQKIRDPYESNHHTRLDVYFSDDYETVERSVVNDESVNYIVLAPKAKLAPEPKPQKKSIWDRIFG